MKQQLSVCHYFLCTLYIYGASLMDYVGECLVTSTDEVILMAPDLTL